jgi:hypothetical protein
MHGEQATLDLPVSIYRGGTDWGNLILAATIYGTTTTIYYYTPEVKSKRC